MLFAQNDLMQNGSGTGQPQFIMDHGFQANVGSGQQSQNAEAVVGSKANGCNEGAAAHSVNQQEANREEMIEQFNLQPNVAARQ